jgi:hypothetical protein
MKLIYCPDCHDMFVAITEKTRMCACRTHAAKYLKDRITTVVTDGAVVVGIDNVSFSNALHRTYAFQGSEKWKGTRIDSFFNGWIPTEPGEVIFVKKPNHVIRYKFDCEYNHTSTNPTTDHSESVAVSADNHEMPLRKAKSPTLKKWSWLQYFRSGP